MAKTSKVIFWLFAALLFFVPLVLWPFTSEVFEFNKMVLVYGLTTLIVAAWLTRSVFVKKIIFRRTILDIPLLIFLGSQFISTILSIDPTTSWLGYYSRFNGGLLSDICYSLLYWAFVSNFELSDVSKLINHSLFPSALFVSIVGILEHFNIDPTCALMGQGWKSCWVQDVQSRVFSTLGQPNWLASWLIAIIPITWALALQQSAANSKFKIMKPKFLIYFGLSVLFFWTIIFTKSRSGYLGMAVAFIVFWGIYLWTKLHKSRLTDPGLYKSKKFLSVFAILSISFFAICLISGTEYTPSIGELLQHKSPTSPTAVQGSTALETGGTESSKIRQIVWKGALQVWVHYPVFGAGVETFGYSYYMFRPAEHNLVSEWDFIYNKAHNEFLNMAANSGTVGLISYLTVIAFVIYVFGRHLDSPLNTALLAGFASLSVTNFFGFSVVPTQLEFFLFPAFAVALTVNEKVKTNSEKLGIVQKIAVILLLPFTFYLLLIISRYWYADTFYNKGKLYNSSSRPDLATQYLTQAIDYEPYQAIYHGELANSYVSIALAYNKEKDATNSAKFANMAISESDTATSLSNANLNLKRSRFGIFIMLLPINPNYLINARDTLIDAIKYAPTDAKLYYNLGLTYARTGNISDALSTLKKTVELKANYKEARLAYAILLIDQKQNTEARAQLEYILKYIDPNDSLTKQTLANIK